MGEAVIDEINNGKYDLIIKAANHHGVLDSIIFTPIDWYILRNSQIPVIIAKIMNGPKVATSLFALTSR